MTSLDVQAALSERERNILDAIATGLNGFRSADSIAAILGYRPARSGRMAVTATLKSLERRGLVGRLAPKDRWDHADYFLRNDPEAGERMIVQGAQERIHAAVKVDANGCWKWQRYIAPTGYGKMGYRRKTYNAHRVSFWVFKGEIPDGMEICHTCDVRDCVNPDHLFAGTRSDNMQDALAKGRFKKTSSVRGSKHHHSKVDEKTVRSIAAMLKKGVDRKVIADRFGLLKGHIDSIAGGYLWRHVTGFPHPSERRGVENG